TRKRACTRRSSRTSLRCRAAASVSACGHSSDGGIVGLVLQAIVIGTGATVVLDAWALGLQRARGIRPLDWALMGRWIGHFPRGRFVHASIAAATPVRGERLLGWC